MLLTILRTSQEPAVAWLRLESACLFAISSSCFREVSCVSSLWKKQDTSWGSGLELAASQLARKDTLKSMLVVAGSPWHLLDVYVMPEYIMYYVRVCAGKTARVAET